MTLRLLEEPVPLGRFSFEERKNIGMTTFIQTVEEQRNKKIERRKLGLIKPDRSTIWRWLDFRYLLADFRQEVQSRRLTS